VESRVSVVIPCYTERRWSCLSAAVRSAREQRPAPAEVVVAVDHDGALADRVRRDLGVTVVMNAYEPGASGNRNTGVLHTRTPLVAMLDDDAVARPGWLAALVAPFADPEVIGTGGAAAAAWPAGQPFWFPDEYLWVVGASFAGGPDRPAVVRNVWSLNMAVRRDTFAEVGGFRVGFGKVGERSRPEDTELCLRMSAVTGGHWRYVPDAVIDHAVSDERARFGYFLRRCYAEGRGKVAMARLGDATGAPAGRLDIERDYLRRTLPRAVARGLARAARGTGAAHAARAAVVVAGVAAAATGGLHELAAGGRP
jgi:GT2 family glycosyltransferase